MTYEANARNIARNTIFARNEQKMGQIISKKMHLFCRYKIESKALLHISITMEPLFRGHTDERPTPLERSLN